jgi:hypothetical protein
MASIDSTHTCHFMLEQNAKGYFTGHFVCSYCGLKVSQSQWLDNLAVTPGREPSHGLSRTPPGQAR